MVSESQVRWCDMRLVLTYSGLLPSGGGCQLKHSIRKSFHPQLARQWEIDSALSAIARKTVGENPIATGIEEIASRFTRGNFRFVPLVTKAYDLACSLEITMLRPEAPGNLIRRGGDIDNRLKILFDSLRVPEASEITGLMPDADEDPFYCLLEDDSLVTGVQVKTERLLEPQSGKDSNIRLIMTAVVRPTHVTIANLAFLGGWL